MTHAAIASPRKGAYNSLSSMAHDANLTRVIEFLKPIALFAELTDGELMALSRDLAQRAFRQGEIIFEQGDPGQVLYLVETGQVRIFVQDADGQETGVNICGPGDVFGELAVIDENPRSASAMAMQDTVLYVLTRDLFREHLRRSPQLALNFMRTLSVRVRYSTQQMNSLAMRDVPTRLARKLLELAQQYGVVEPKGVRIRLALTQSDLASAVGATRESTNKALGAFRRQGLVLVEQGNLTILDPEALRDLAS